MGTSTEDPTLDEFDPASAESWRRVIDKRLVDDLRVWLLDAGGPDSVVGADEVKAWMSRHPISADWLAEEIEANWRSVFALAGGLPMDEPGAWTTTTEGNFHYVPAGTVDEKVRTGYW